LSVLLYVVERQSNGSDASEPGKWTTLPRADFEDVVRAHSCISFGDGEPDSGGGDRHVEFRIAFALAPRVIVVDRMENMFQLLPSVEHCDQWTAALAAIDHGAEGPTALSC
jgi:hypothetical protein